jgi:predicted O-methyltransferase YrrM
VEEHSLHSPFFFDFYKGVVKARAEPLEKVEQLRSQLLKDEREIFVNDLGTGKSSGNKRKISSIAKSTLSSAKFSSLFRRIISRYHHRVVIELGTSLGINALYLASARDTHVTTFEGASEIAKVAELTLEFAGYTNITLIEGDINVTLPAYLQTIRKFDFAFIDANHTYEATILYSTQFRGKLH